MSDTQRDAPLSRLRQLSEEAKELRRTLAISGEGEVIFKGSLNFEEDVVVTADGFGGALLEIVEGNHPVDYQRKGQRFYEDEDDACDIASRMVERANGEAEDDNEIESIEEEIRGESKLIGPSGVVGQGFIISR